MKKHCPKCGSEFTGVMKYCASCGEALRDKSKQDGKKSIKKISILLFSAILLLAGFLVWFNVIMPSSQYQKAKRLIEYKEYEEAIDIFKKLGSYKDSKAQVDILQSCEEQYEQAIDFLTSGKNLAALGAMQGLAGYRDVVVLQNKLYAGIYKKKSVLVSGDGHMVGLRSNGTVIADGDNSYGECDVESWRDIVAVSAGKNHTVGLKKDGTVVAVGDNSRGQCDVESWTDIVAVSAAGNYTVGLKSDRTVVSSSGGSYGGEEWTDIVAVSAWASWGGGSDEPFVIGLKSDGDVVAEGGYCTDLKNGVDIAPIGSNPFALSGVSLCANGKIEGYNMEDVELVAVATRMDTTVYGLSCDGTLVVLESDNKTFKKIESMNNIVGLHNNSSGEDMLRNTDCIIALKSDGAVAVECKNESYPFQTCYCDIVKNWSDLMVYE